MTTKTLKTVLSIVSLIFVQSCQTPAQQTTDVTLASQSKLNIEAASLAATEINESDFMRHVNILACDEFEETNSEPFVNKVCRTSSATS